MKFVASGQRLSLALALALLSSQTLAAPFAQLGRAPIDAANPVVAALRAERSTAALNLMQIDSSVLSADSDRLEIRLAGNRTVVARRSGSRFSEDGTLVWEGYIEGKTNPAGADGRAQPDDLLNTVTLVKSGDEVAGTLRIDGRLHRLSSLGRGQHVLAAIDESKLPPDHPEEYKSLPVANIGTEDHGNKAAGTKAISTIRVMVVITDRAKTKIGNITNFVNLAISETNAGYTNSGVEITAQLAGTYTTSYVESGSMSTDLARIRGTTDGYMDSVHSLRNTNAADIVMFVIDNAASCGLASGIGATASTAFAAVHYSCATGYYSFGHEMGHLQSARHDPANDPTTTPYAYGHGYQYAAGGWRTIMAYACSTGTCNRINYWSNPAKLRSGVPMGTTSTHHNQRVLNNTKATIAAFR
ncbi:MAG: peptidyl-Asp metalloendopeptidase [Rhodanobacteraceae bacterium]|nr:peptidyl-Asp metalloendopeptidase [Rhodanobacteraceae bacterium]